MPSRSGDPVLTRRQLNRALLGRQLLLRRADLAVPDALEHLIGLQAQAPKPPYLGLWTRLLAFRPEQLSDLIRDRAAVRIALMRSTIHLVTARDCLALRPVVQSVIDRSLLPSAFGRQLTPAQTEALAAQARILLEEQPRTLNDLVGLLRERWPVDDDAGSLASAVRALLALVQVPPRGLWGTGGPPVVTTAQAWLGRALPADPSPDDVVLRYLGAFGPASAADAQVWSGLTGLRAVFDRLRPRLRSFRDERGVELFDVPDAVLPDADAPAPVRFLPEYDNVLLSHADRTRVIADEHRRRIATRNGQVPGTVLVDGFVRGMWRVARESRGARLEIQLFEDVSPLDRGALETEGETLLRVAAADADTIGVVFARAG